jgi:membrane protease subunit HflK
MKLRPGEIGHILIESLHGLQRYIKWIAACLLLLYLLSGFYAVSSNQVGVLERFGAVVHDKIQPGIHYGLPWPIDRITKVPVKTVSRIVIDDFYSLSGPKSMARVFAGMTGLDSYCLTGDNNLANVKCIIQYTITDPRRYLFRSTDQHIMLRSMACSTIIHCIAAMPIDEALTRGKQKIARFIAQKLQQRMDSAQCGLSVSFVELSDIKPPDRVEQAFSDVVKADMDRRKMINEAQSYRNETLPDAQARASRIIQEAEAYKKTTVLTAQGETQRFSKLLSRYRKKGAPVKNMLYLESMSQIGKNIGTTHLVVPGGAGKPPAGLNIYRPNKQ